MSEIIHSVTLDKDKCKGCTNCIKRCPTEAIRVRDGKAVITDERCVDCGECIRVCPYHAKKAVADSLFPIDRYAHTIALPAPSLYGQYAFDRGEILGGLITLGFDEVFEVAVGAKIISGVTQKLLQDKTQTGPLISSACPAVVKMIQVRFPELIDRIITIESPMEISARIAREKAVKQTGYASDQIGVFFISPCAAKVTTVKSPYEKKRSDVDVVVAMHDIYAPLREAIKKSEGCVVEGLSDLQGIVWADAGGESSAQKKYKTLAVDGISNVIAVFEELENGQLDDLDFIEALACTTGCLGGPLAVENPFVAKTRLRDKKDVKKKDDQTMSQFLHVDFQRWNKPIEYKPILKLDKDFGKAVEMLEEIEALTESLTGLDCGACGAPGCRAFAEDVVKGLAKKTDCIIELKERMKQLESKKGEEKE